MRLWMRLAGALLAGCVVGGGVWLYLKDARQKIDAHYQMTHVWRAKRHIGAGRPVVWERVERSAVPEAFVEPLAITQREEIMDAEGHPRLIARIGILKGEQITRSKTYDNTELPGLAWRIPEDHVAVTLRLSAEAAVGGWAVPGDWVSLLATLDAQPGWPEPETLVVLSRVRIAAVDGELAARVGPGGGKFQRPMDNQAVLVTLSVTPAQAAVATFASEKGRVRLALTSPLAAAAPAGRAGFDRLRGRRGPG